MRIWRSSPFVALMTVLALAMGIGFTTTMFSIVHGATRPLPFTDAHELVALEKVTPRASEDAGIVAFDYGVWSASASLAAVGAFESIELNVAGSEGQPERLRGVRITANTFPMLGTTALIGRTLQPDDLRVGATPVVVLSHRLWARRFASNPGLIGQSIRLTGTPHLVVGVMPERFGFPVNASFWTPLTLEGFTNQPRTRPFVTVFGRLAPGASFESARAELDGLTAAAYRDAVGQQAASGIRVRVIPFQDIETPREVIRGLYLLVVAVSFVMLIACANVANLLIARAATQARDVAVRLALGATRRRLAWNQLGETLSLALLATVLGVGFAYAGTRLFASNTSHIIEAFWVDFRVDTSVLLFASVLAGAAAMAAGLTPALRATRIHVADVLKDGAAGSSSLLIGRLSRWMIGGQVALACGLLAMTMVFARSSLNLRNVPWPFDPSSIMTFEIELADERADDITQKNRWLRDVSQALNATPGVEVAGFATLLPGRADGGWTVAVDTPAAPGEGENTVVSLVSPEFFTVTGARALSGRLFSWNDDPSAPRVAIVNASFVRRHWPDRDPIGRTIFVSGRDHTIVGVVPDLMARDVQRRRQDGVYLSILQSRAYGIRVMVRGPADPTTMMPSLRAAITQLDPDLPLTEVFTLYEAVYREKRVLDVLSTLFLVFGIGALSLTAIGVYGVISFAVTQRTREIGIRFALGATRAQVLRLVVGQGTRQLIVGVSIGLVLAVALSRGFAAAVEQLPPADAPLLLWIACAIVITGASAVAVPAYRATRTQMLRALRTN
jgi:predicted permease